MTNAEMIFALLYETIDEIRIKTNIPDVSKKGCTLTYKMSRYYGNKIAISVEDSYNYDHYNPEEAYRFLEGIINLTPEVKAEPVFKTDVSEGDIEDIVPEEVTEKTV